MGGYVELGEVRTWYDEHGDGPPLVLLRPRRPDPARRGLLISGVFHRDGWIPEVIDPDREPHEALARGYAELSPDGADHFPVVAAKLKRMDFREPTLQAAYLRGLPNRTLVMVADDEEVTLEHTDASIPRVGRDVAPRRRCSPQR